MATSASLANCGIYGASHPFMTRLDSSAAFSTSDGTANGALLRDGFHPKIENYKTFLNLLPSAAIIPKLP